MSESLLDGEVFGSLIGGVLEEEEVEKVEMLRKREVGGAGFDKGLCFNGECREKVSLRSSLILLLMAPFFSFFFFEFLG